LWNTARRFNADLPMIVIHDDLDWPPKADQKGRRAATKECAQCDSLRFRDFIRSDSVGRPPEELGEEFVRPV
jgi:hypothetical protein